MSSFFNTPFQTGHLRPGTRPIMLVLLAVGLMSAIGVAEKTSPKPVTLREPEQTRIQSHPFLLVTESDFEELQERAQKQPWKRMKKKVVSHIQKNEYKPHHWSRMWRMTNHGALAYILDPDNRTDYVRKVADTLKQWKHFYENRGHYDSHNKVPLGAAYMSSVLALDIVHDDLAADTLGEIEKWMGKMGEWYRRTGRWELNQYGCAGIWAMYERKFDDSAAKNYIRELRDVQINPDGTFREGSTYAIARLGCDQPARQGKVTLMHALEALDVYDFYSRNRYQNFYECLFGYSTAPHVGRWSFCDSGTGTYGHTQGLGVFTASRFSDRAARLAAWVTDSAQPPADLLHYVLMDKQLPSPREPSSHIFPYGLAVFMPDGLTEKSLSGALWNQILVGDHSHNDTNALHLAGYGKHLLRNVGYPGYPPPRRAETNNVLMIDGANHNTINKQDTRRRIAIKNEKEGGEEFAAPGGGIEEGFTGGNFDFARGFAGESLRPQGLWWRNFCFVHPADNTPGYFVVFDEVNAKDASKSVNTVWHPNTSDLAAKEDGWRYMFDIGDDVSLDIALPTPPDTVEVRTREDNLARSDFDGKYLYTTYSTNGSGKAIVATVLFPSDDDHPRPTFKRVSGDGFTGAQLRHPSGAVDRICTSRSGEMVELPSFRGIEYVARTVDGKPGFYFVRHSTYFGSKENGFSSEDPVTLYIDGLEGKIISRGTYVTFRRQGTFEVLIDGQPAGLLSRTDSKVRLYVPAGTHSISFE